MKKNLKLAPSVRFSLDWALTLYSSLIQPLFFTLKVEYVSTKYNFWPKNEGEKCGGLEKIILNGYFYQNICNLGPFYEVRENAHLQMMVGTHRIIGLSDIWIISVSDWRRFFVPFRTHERFINRHLKFKKKIVKYFDGFYIYSYFFYISLLKFR